VTVVNRYEFKESPNNNHPFLQIADIPGLPKTIKMDTTDHVEYILIPYSTSIL